MPAPDFTFDLATGRGTIDGVDFRVLRRGAAVILEDGEAVRVVAADRRLDPALSPGGDGDASVEVPDEASIIIDWLESLDVNLVEQEVLNSHAWLQPPPTMGHAWIMVLQRLATLA